MSIFFSCPDAMTIVPTMGQDGATPSYEYAETGLPDVSITEAHAMLLLSSMGMPETKEGEWLPEVLPDIRNRLSLVVRGKPVFSASPAEQLAAEFNTRKVPLDAASGYVATRAFQLLRVVDAAIARNMRVTWG